MAVERKTDDRTAFDRFKELDPGAPRRCYSEVGFFAYVTVMGGCWAWTVWRGNEPVAGRRDYRLDADRACAEALAALEAIKAQAEVALGT